MVIKLEKDPNSNHLFFSHNLFYIHFRPYLTSFESGYITVIKDNKRNKCIYNSYLPSGKVKSIDELLRLTSTIISKNFNENKGVFVNI